MRVDIVWIYYGAKNDDFWCDSVALKGIRLNRMKD